jgi:hypothetical protein
VLARYKEFLEYHNRKEVLDHLWAVIEEEFGRVDPKVLYVIAEHKLDIAEQIQAIGGAKLKEEAHGGARNRTSQGRHRGRKGALSRLGFKLVVLRRSVYNIPPTIYHRPTPRLAQNRYPGLSPAP